MPYRHACKSFPVHICGCIDCRPGRKGGNQTGRGVLSMQGLSYGVVRVDDENSLMSLTLQDCGQVLPGGMLGLCSISIFLFRCQKLLTKSHRN